MFTNSLTLSKYHVFKVNNYLVVAILYIHKNLYYLVFFIITLFIFTLMNLKQLKSLCTILDEGSFAAAGHKIGLTQSAISIQMQQLESELEISLFDRKTRPPTITADGVLIAKIAGEALKQTKKIKQVATGNQPGDHISIGFVQSCTQHLLPRVLNEIRKDHPELRIYVKTGLSNELASAVIHRDLDYALVTSPMSEILDLKFTEIKNEPLMVIAPPSLAHVKSDVELIRSMPFISFSKRTWLGQKITTTLQMRGILAEEIMEIDSLDAIEDLVTQGFGVSIVPKRLLAESVQSTLTQIPFGNPVEGRNLVLIERRDSSQPSIDKLIHRIFRRVASISLVN